MKLPIEGMMSTVITGLVLTAIFALIANVVNGGWWIDLILVLVIWLIMFGLLRKPTPPKS
ncbi:MAG TPA: hypothetical protein VK009_12690 [Chloroflexota bacterium]|nr:hypothetical protein [Chloroflexota bacterium]